MVSIPLQSTWFRPGGGPLLSDVLGTDESASGRSPPYTKCAEIERFAHHAVLGDGSNRIGGLARVLLNVERGPATDTESLTSNGD